MPALFLHVLQARPRNHVLRAVIDVHPNFPAQETSVPSRDGVTLEILSDASEHVGVKLYHEGSKEPSGSVDIPVDSLVPNQLWNVWYALEGAMESVHLVLYLNSTSASTHEADIKVRQLKVQKMARELLHSSTTTRSAELVSRHSEYDGSPKSLRDKSLNSSHGMQVAEDAVKVNEVLQAQNKELRDNMVELERRNGELLAKICEQQKARTQDQSQSRLAVGKTYEERESAMKSLEELQVDLSYANAQLKSKQLRVESLERDLEIHQHRVSMADTMEEQMRTLKIESMKHLDERVHIQQKLDSYRRQSEQISEELLGKLSHNDQELERALHRTQVEKHQREALEQQLASSNAERRKLSAGKVLLEEEVDAIKRESTCLKAEKEAMELTVQRLRERVKEVEEKWTCERVANLQVCVEQHDGVVQELRMQLEEYVGNIRDVEDELRESSSRARSLDGQLDREKERSRHLNEELVATKEASTLSKELQMQNDQLKDRLEQVLCDTRLMAENFERDSTILRDSNIQILAEKDTLVLECALKERKVAEHERKSQMAEEGQENVKLLSSQCEEFCRQGEASASEAQRSQKDFEDASRHAGELTQELRDVTEALIDANAENDRQKQHFETQLKLRERDTTVLLARIQKLASNYAPIKGDIVDETLSRWIFAYQPAVPFVRIGAGLYTFGKRQVLCKISNDKPVFRVGGGFIGFDAFLDRFADEELTKLLYENDNENENNGLPERVLSRRSLTRPSPP